MQVQIVWGHVKEFFKEKPKEIEIISNKREVRIGASSNNGECTVFK